MNLDGNARSLGRGAEMSGQEAYDTEEARGILVRLSSELLPPLQNTAEGRTEAAEQLLKEAMALLSETGFEVSHDADQIETATLKHVGSVRLRAEVGEIQVTGVRAHMRGAMPSIGWHTAELEMNSTCKLEGRDKRGALAVVADLVDKCMRESAQS